LKPVPKSASWFKNYTPAIIWTGVIFILISIPGNYLVPFQRFVFFNHFDKVVHIGIFGVLIVACMYGSFKEYNVGIFSVQTAVALFIAVFIGAISEIMQAYILIDRDGSKWDFVADCTGCAAGVIFFWWLNKKILKG